MMWYVKFTHEPQCTMRINNPLAAIATFAGISEVFAVVVLLQLPEPLQHIFVWFVMGFPVLLVVSFFGVLIFKPTVFYAPDDYQEAEHYLIANNIKKTIEKEFDKTSEEISKSNNGENALDLKLFKNRLVRSVLSNIHDESERRVLKFLTRLGCAHTTKAISMANNLSKEDATNILEALEAKGLVEGGVDLDSGHTYWSRIPINNDLDQ